MLRFQVFGGVAVVAGDGTPVALSRRERQFLACLLVREGHVASCDELVDGIWGRELPTDPRNSLQVLAKRVRDSLGGSGRAVVVNVGDGYGLAVDHRACDVDVLRRLGKASRALRQCEPGVAGRLVQRCVAVSAGELPEAPLESAASDDIWELTRLREDIRAESTGPGPGAYTPAWRGPAGVEEHVVMVLRLTELDDMSLADVVIAATDPAGLVRSLSNGVLVVAYREAGGAVRAARRSADALSGDGNRLLGGAVERLGAGGAQPVVASAATAFPGQILVSRSVAAAAATAAPEVLLSEAGTDTWQIGFPRGPSGGHPGGSAVELVGRKADLDTVVDLLASGALTTIRGPGGIGKSRLAREMMHRAPDGLVDGATVIDLTGADLHGGALALVALGLGILSEPFRPLIDTVVDRLSGTRWLLVLDNCEDALADVRALCVALREGCEGVRVVATSRAAIGAGHEQIHDLDRLERHEIGRLLVTLAGEQTTGAQTPAGAQARDLLDRLSELVDGMPLAAECAAALLRQLGLPATVLALSELPDGAVLPLLDAAQGGLGRHHSVEAALLASWRVLDPADRLVFERLSSLRGRFNSDDALVAAPADPPGDVTGALGRLRDASLVKQEAADTWSMLEPVRQFAATRLLRDGQQAIQAARHCAHFVATAERHERSLRSPEEAEAFARINRSYPNLAAALTWAVESGDARSALRIAGSLWWWWAAQGMFVDGAAALERALGVPGEAPAVLRASALIAHGHLLWWAGSPAQTASDCEEALRLTAGQNSPTAVWCRAWALMAAAAARMWGGGQLATLERRLERAVSLLAPLGDHTGSGIAHEVYGGLAWHHGEYDVAARCSARALEHFEACGHQTMIAQGRRVVGLTQGLLGDTDAGLAMIADGLRLSEHIGDIGGLPLGYCFLGLVESYAGRERQADQAFATSLRHNRERGQLWAALLALTHAGGRAVVAGQAGDGVRLLTAARSITRTTRIAVAPRERALATSAFSIAARTLRPAELRAARSAGRALGVAEAMALATSVLDG